jgi:hypothetical protein
MDCWLYTQQQIVPNSGSVGGKKTTNPPQTNTAHIETTCLEGI